MCVYVHACVCVGGEAVMNELFFRQIATVSQEKDDRDTWNVSVCVCVCVM